MLQGFPGGSVVKNLPANAGDAGYLGSILGLGRSPKKDVATHSRICLANSMDRGVWWATVQGAAKSWTVLSISTDKVWQQTKIRLNRNDLES